MNKNDEKNINIELLRCIACYFVIVIHTWGTFRMEGGIFRTEVFVGGVVARCAVPVFFMITGYVYNNRGGLVHKYKKFISRVLLPALLMTFFTSVILARGIHFFLDESQEYISVIEYLKVILTGNMPDLYLSFHFWYIEELITFYLLLPLLQFVLCDEERANKIRRFYLIIGFLIYFVVPVVEKIGKIEVNNTYLPDGLLYIWYIILGFELSKWNWKYAGRIGMVSHWICILIMSLLEYHLEYLVTGDIQHVYSANGSIFTCLSAIGLFLFVANIKIPKRFHNGINRIGKATLGIYIVHVVVYSILYQLKITIVLKYVPTVVFCLIYATSVFVISFVGIKILEMFYGLIVSNYKKERMLINPIDL